MYSTRTIIRPLMAVAAIFSALSCKGDPEENAPSAYMLSFSFCGQPTSIAKKPCNVPCNGVSLEYSFTQTIDADKGKLSDFTISGADISAFTLEAKEGDDKTIVLKSIATLPAFTQISVELKEGLHFGIKVLDNTTFTFTTEYDPSDKFPRISGEELFEKVQKAAFMYFWDHAHPVSGLARERKGSGNTVTSGGSGFGLMTIPVGIERGWISREEGTERALKTISFLDSRAERFHGAWPHWLDGESGKAIAFSNYDNGADLVETAFMVQGLIALKHYFNGSDEKETTIRTTIDRLWREVEWDWFTQNGQKQLFWHWSPDHEWKMNMGIRGWNEGLIVYVLAAASPTHPIDKETYISGWTSDGRMTNDLRGPLFFTHYSFLGLDPRNLSDDLVGSYWEMNVRHATYNHDYCAKKSTSGYSDSCWGLTASDYSKGYTASSPANDTGTVAPTAALASFPYVPELSAKAMEYFYYVLGDRLWGEYGLKDAFSLKDRWFAGSYIAIDEGPIVVMMENHRTGLLWNCFMQDEDIMAGLDRLGFKY